MNRRVLDDLIPIRGPDTFLREAMKCCTLDDQTPEGALVTNAFQTVYRLYGGGFVGYARCETPYHDFAHAAEVFLAMARLLHGAVLDSAAFFPRDLAVGLTAAILHDAGYIYRSEEVGEGGAYFRAEHEERSVAFAARHGEAFGLTRQEIDDCGAIIRGTKLTVDVNTLAFRSQTLGQLVRLLAAADLLAQLSSSTYLERLLFLHAEDQASPAPHYPSLQDCYRKAIQFDAAARARLQATLEQADVYLVKHFSARWNTPANLYQAAMDRQITFLAGIIAEDSFDPHRHLRRWGSVKTLPRLMSSSRPWQV